MQTITNLTKSINGYRRLPSGAVPIAQDQQCSVVCLMPTGRWIRWDGSSIETMPGSTQREVINLAISELGGTAKTLADKLDLSRRTVETWRICRQPLPIAQAYRIAELLAK